MTHPLVSPAQLRARWASGSPTYGVWCVSGTAGVARQAAAMGYDWLGLDVQHSALDDAHVVHALRDAEECNIPVLVRTRGSDPDMLGWMLDMGADGVIVPMIENRAQAEALVGATRYAPLGSRSFGPVRALERGVDAVQAYQHRPLVFAMIETATAVANVDEIAAVDGIDGLFVGPGDLTVSIGRPPSLDQPDEILDGLICEVGRAAEAHGLVSGIYSRSAEVLHRYRRAGFRLLVAASDRSALSIGLSSLLADAQKPSVENVSRMVVDTHG